MKPQIIIKSATSSGKLKTLDIIAKHIEDIRSLKLTLRTDPTVVKVKQCRWVSKQSGGGMGYNVTEAGQINISWYGAPPIDFPHNKPIIKLQFQRVAAGTSPIEVMEDVSDFACRMTINNADYPDDAKTYKNGKITFK
jgi:hypothetical protein